MQASPLQHHRKINRKGSESILYPNIPPRKDPDALTFLSASAISCMASFSLPELSMASWVCRWRSDGRKTGPMFRSGRRRERSRRETSLLPLLVVLMLLLLTGCGIFFYGERERSVRAQCRHLLERAGKAVAQNAAASFARFLVILTYWHVFMRCYLLLWLLSCH